MEKTMLVPHLQNYQAAPNLLLNEQVKELQRQGQKVHNLAFGQSPFPVFEKAQKALCDHAGLAPYTKIAGLDSLRLEIANFHAKVDGLHVQPDNIIVGPGTKQLSYLLFSVFAGDIFLSSPCWTTYPSQVKLSNKTARVVETRPSDSWKMLPKALEEEFSKSQSTHKVLVLINPDNPSGVCYNKEELVQIAETCRKHRVIILSDEIYGLLNFTDDHHCMAKYYPEGTILQSGISKWGSAGGWRLGYHIYPDSLLELYSAVHKAASHTHSCVSAPVQYAAIEYFKYDEECQLFVKHCRRILAAVALYCYQQLSRAGLSVVRPGGTYYLIVDFEMLRSYLSRRGIETGVQLGELLLKETQVSLMACGPGFLRPCSEFSFRVSYINFDGASALNRSMALGLEQPLGEEFVTESCKDTAAAINAIVNWVRSAVSG